MILKKISLNWAVPCMLLLFTFHNAAAQRLPRRAADTSILQQNPKITSFVVPATLLLYGFLEPHVSVLHRLDASTNAELREDHLGFSSHLDNYLRYVPAAAVYGMDAMGLKAKHNLIDRSVLLLMAGTITSTTVTFSKNHIYRIRPNGSVHSFPSGHTSMAFMTAEFMHQEYKDDYPLISLLGYATATATGVLRLYNGAHWVSDVVAGAGYGMLSTKVSYLLYPMLKRMIFHNRPVHLVIMPVRQPSFSGLAMVHTF